MAGLFEFLSDFSSCRFRDDLIVTSSLDLSLKAPKEVDCCSLE